MNLEIANIYCPAWPSFECNGSVMAVIMSDDIKDKHVVYVGIVDEDVARLPIGDPVKHKYAEDICATGHKCSLTQAQGFFQQMNNVNYIR